MPHRATSTARVGSPWSWATGGLLAGAVAGLLMFAPASWLAQLIVQRTDGHVVLAQARGTIWNGSAQLVLAAGADSQVALALPGRRAYDAALKGANHDDNHHHGAAQVGSRGT